MVQYDPEEPAMDANDQKRADKIAALLRVDRLVEQELCASGTVVEQLAVLECC